MARQTARTIARKWGVSAREARKHFAAGTTPESRTSRRRASDAARDDDQDFARPASPRVLVEEELLAARGALQRAASSEEFTDEDLRLLRSLIAEGQQLMREWEETVAEVEGAIH